MKTVCCIMLANGRAEMVARAVASFHAQDYPEKRLIIWNTGAACEFDKFDNWKDGRVAVIDSESRAAIGGLRNAANASGLRLWDEVDIFAHWDSDDWSHPKRLTECVELLKNTAADVVGYRECLFFDTRPGRARYVTDGEAWTYRNGNPSSPIGSSMVYRREAWERKPFPLNHTGEDTLWLLNGRFKIHAVPSTWSWTGLPNHEPRMICAIHGENTASEIKPGAAEWQRSPIFDAYCRERMRLL